jgi:hypothetical protein
LPTASDDRHNADIQAVAIGGAHGADHYYYNDVPGSRWRGGLLIVIAVLALAVLAGTFAYRAMFGGYTFPALQEGIAKARNANGLALVSNKISKGKWKGMANPNPNLLHFERGDVT